MTEKKNEIKIQGDYLDRGRYARSLYRIIGEYTTNLDNTKHANTDNKAFVLAVSGKWGTGKTYFIERFEKILWLDTKTLGTSAQYFPEKYAFKEENVFHYDAWKKDFCDNAFIPLYDAILQGEFGLFKRKEFANDKIIKLFKDIGYDAIQLIADFIGKTGKALAKATDTSTMGSVPSAAIEGVAETLEDALKDLPENLKKYYTTLTKKYDPAEDSFPEYVKFSNAIELLKEVLAYAVQKTERIAIVIDELDRCKPTFAVQTLEIVKHLFNVPGIVFIFSLDITELQHCVKNVYGVNFNAVGYLERFFDYTSLLPSGDMQNLFKQTLKDFKCTDDPDNVYCLICNKFHLSIREIRAVCSAFHYLEEFELEGYPRHARQLYFYLLVMKYKEPVRVIDAISDASDGNDAREYLMNNYPPMFKPTSDKATQAFVEAFKANATIGTYNQFKRIYENGDPDLMTQELDAFDELESGSLSYALYAPDHKIKEDIKEFRLLEYLFRKVELYDTAIKESPQGDSANAGIATAS